MRETLNATLVPDFLCASTQLFTYSTQVSIAAAVAAEGFDCPWSQSLRPLLDTDRPPVTLKCQTTTPNPTPPLQTTEIWAVTAWNKLTARPQTGQRCPKPITTSLVTFVAPAAQLPQIKSMPNSHLPYQKASRAQTP